MLFKFLQRGLGALGGVALASCAGVSATPADAASGHPALWQVSDRDTQVYLFGTIHLLPKDYSWRTPKFDQALNGSQALIVETIVDEAHPQSLAADLARLGYSNGLPPLISRVAPDKVAALKAAMARSGVPLTQFERMETWAAAFILLGTQFSDLGVTGGAGVETVLRANFTAAGKPIGQLETNSEQLGFFDTLPENAQRQLLEGAIETPGDTRADFNGMLSAWARGDVDSVASTFNKDLAGSPELVDALIRRRNLNWSHWIERRMASPGSAFLAVGAGHLAGNQSVIALLKHDGYKVRRIQ